MRARPHLKLIISAPDEDALEATTGGDRISAVRPVHVARRPFRNSNAPVLGLWGISLVLSLLAVAVLLAR